MKKIYKLTIEITGESLEDLGYSIDEAKKNILKGYSSGMDRNESGDYSFQCTHLDIEDNE